MAFVGLWERRKTRLFFVITKLQNKEVCYNGVNPSGGMIFLNNHVLGFRGISPWR